jgi:NAD-specific glutamate dehydrogenase
VAAHGSMAYNHAHGHRGMPTWKAFTTGKSPKFGAAQSARAPKRGRRTRQADPPRGGWAWLRRRGPGGIPHDKYGMTTRSVHQYVLGILRKNNIRVRAR